MATIGVLLLCGGGLLLSLMSSVALSERLDQVGYRFRLPPPTSKGLGIPEPIRASSFSLGVYPAGGRRAGPAYQTNLDQL